LNIDQYNITNFHLAKRLVNHSHYHGYINGKRFLCDEKSGMKFRIGYEESKDELCPSGEVLYKTNVIVNITEAEGILKTIR